MTNQKVRIFTLMCTTLIIVGCLILSAAETAVSTPSYEVPHPALSAAAISQGKGHVNRLEDLSQQEGYLTRIWRSNCFTSALEHLGITHCQSMSPEQKSRLALALANCQLQMLGQKTHTCSEATPLQKCTESFPDDRSYNTFTEQLAQIDSICMYHMHDSFGKRTELLMHELADATSGALQMSSGILDALGGMDGQLQGMGGALQSMSRKQDAMSEVAGQVLDQAQGLATRVAGISTDLGTLQQAGDLLVQRSSDMLRALAELDAAELKRYRQNALMWQDAKQDALAFHAQLAAMRASEMEVSARLSSELRQLSSMSESIAQRVDVAVDMQQKANRVLTHVLGAQYTLSDVAFYGGSAVVIAMMGSNPSTRAARLPMAALLLCNWAAEHWLLTRFDRHLEVDDTGTVYAQLQLPTWPQRSAKALKGLVRQCWTTASSVSIQKVLRRGPGPDTWGVRAGQNRGESETTPITFRLWVKSALRWVFTAAAAGIAAWTLLAHAAKQRAQREQEAAHAREIAEILAVMRKAEWQERQQWEGARLALAEAPNQTTDKQAGHTAHRRAPPELAASSAKSGARPIAQLPPVGHAARAAERQSLLSPVTPPPPQEEPVNESGPAEGGRRSSESASGHEAAGEDTKGGRNPGVAARKERGSAADRGQHGDTGTALEPPPTHEAAEAAAGRRKASKRSRSAETAPESPVAPKKQQTRHARSVQQSV